MLVGGLMVVDASSSEGKGQGGGGGGQGGGGKDQMGLSEEGLEPVGESLGDRARAGIGEGVFILLFILVWRAVAGPSEPGVENKVKLALSPLPMPEGSAVHAHPTVREAPPLE